MQLSQIAKIVSCVAPIDTAGVARLGAHINMSKYNHVAFVITIGVANAAACTLTVLAAPISTGAGGVAMAFNYRIATAGAPLISVLEGVLTAAGVGGLILTNAVDDNKVLVVEVDAAELVAPTVNYYVGCNFSGAATVFLVSCVAICCEPRYEANAPIMPDPTVA